MNGLDAPIRTLGLIGTRNMGRGLAVLAASHGVDVIAVDFTNENIEASRQEIEQTVQGQLQKWTITEAEAKLIRTRIRFTTDLTAVAEADLLLECTIDTLANKQQLFELLGKTARPGVILASNTSTLSITELATASGRASEVVGLHFLHPVLKTDVVELVRGLHTSEETVAQATTLVQFLGKTAVEVYESVGYVTTRLIAPMINEAIAALSEGVATAEGIDTAMRLGFQMKYGPLELADRMGLDVVLLRLERLWAEYGDLKYRPAPLLKKLVRAGNLGAAVGQGFFRYDDEQRRLAAGG